MVRRNGVIRDGGTRGWGWNRTDMGRYGMGLDITMRQDGKVCGVRRNGVIWDGMGWYGMVWNNMACLLAPLPTPGITSRRVFQPRI